MDESTQSETLAKLDEIGVEGLSWLQDFSSKGIGFIEEQAPELCNEIIFLGIFQTTFLFVMFSIFTILFGIVWRHGHRKICKQIKTDFLLDVDPPEFIVLWMIPCVATACGVVGMLVNAHTALTIWIAPRLYLLEYFTDLMMKVSNN